MAKSDSPGLSMTPYVMPSSGLAKMWGDRDPAQQIWGNAVRGCLVLGVGASLPWAKNHEGERERMQEAC